MKEILKKLRKLGGFSVTLFFPKRYVLTDAVITIFSLNLRQPLLMADRYSIFALKLHIFECIGPICPVELLEQEAYKHRRAAHVLQKTSRVYKDILCYSVTKERSLYVIYRLPSQCQHINVTSLTRGQDRKQPNSCFFQNFVYGLRAV